MSLLSSLSLIARPDQVHSISIERLYDNDGQPIPMAMREIAGRIGAIPLAQTHEGREMFSSAAWRLIDRVEAGLTAGNLFGVYRLLISGLPLSTQWRPAHHHTLQRFRGMVEAQGWYFARAQWMRNGRQWVVRTWCHDQRVMFIQPHDSLWRPTMRDGMEVIVPRTTTKLGAIGTPGAEMVHHRLFDFPPATPLF